jgi:hypothetical protein
MHKLMSTFFVVALLNTAGFASASEDGPSQRRQLYTVVNKIYTIAEAKETKLYKYLYEKGVSAEDMDQPNAFVQSHTDVSIILRRPAFLRDSYLPPAMRTEIDLGTIVVTNRYNERDQHVTNSIIPRDHTSSYECIKGHRAFLDSISDCVENIETATILKQE